MSIFSLIDNQIYRHNRGRKDHSYPDVDHSRGAEKRPLLANNGPIGRTENGLAFDLKVDTKNLAEGAGFEPARSVNPYTLSRRAPSTTRPPLRLAREPHKFADAPKRGHYPPGTSTSKRPARKASILNGANTLTGHGYRLMGQYVRVLIARSP